MRAIPHEFVNGVECKRCCACKEYVSLDNFCSKTNSRDGLNPKCNPCSKEYNRKNYEKNRDKVKNKSREYYETNREKINEQKRGSEKIKQAQKEYCLKNKEKIKQIRRAYREKNRDKLRQMKKNWTALNLDRARATRNSYDKKKRNSDPIYKLLINTRTRINQAIKNNSKVTSTIELIGCSIEELKTYLSSKFKEGMDWSNHGKGSGKWNIDHIRPCVSFDLSDPEQQKICFHHTNLQPLWETENLKKGDRIVTQ